MCTDLALLAATHLSTWPQIQCSCQTFLGGLSLRWFCDDDYQERLKMKTCLKNIARGAATTGPGYRVHNLSLQTRWRHLQIWPVAVLAPVTNLVRSQLDCHIALDCPIFFCLLVMTTYHIYNSKLNSEWIQRAALATNYVWIVFAASAAVWVCNECTAGATLTAKTVRY